eukprot:6332304-Ditylum_brightwellii.AAC.1
MRSAGHTWCCICYRRKTSRLCPRRPVVPNDGRRLKNAGVGLGSVTQRDLKVPRRNAGSPL